MSIRPAEITLKSTSTSLASQPTGAQATGSGAQHIDEASGRTTTDFDAKSMLGMRDLWPVGALLGCPTSALWSLALGLPLLHL